MIKQFTHWFYKSFFVGTARIKGCLRNADLPLSALRRTRSKKTLRSALSDESQGENAHLASGSSVFGSSASDRLISYTLPRDEAVESLNRILYSSEQLGSANPRRQGQLCNQFGDTENYCVENLDTLADAAFLCDRQGRLAEAESLYKRVVLLTQQQFGEDSVETAYALAELASLYISQNRYSEAEPLLYKALCIRVEHLLVGHIDIAQNCYQLASVYRHQYHYEKAEPLFQCALSMFRDKLGPNHPRTQSVYDDLMHMLTTVIDAGQYHRIAERPPPLDLDNLSDRYSWARPKWHEP